MIIQKKVRGDDIVKALNNGAMVITANKRLAGITLQKFEKANIDKGLNSWPTPNIFPWTIWLQNTWEEAIVSGLLTGPDLLLTQQQELCIWENIITTAVDNPLLQLNATARQAQQAWQLVQAWQLKLDERDRGFNVDNKEFKKWSAEFEVICQKRNWLSMARLTDAITPIVKQGGVNIAKEVKLFGFEELTPQQESLLSVLSDSGSDVSWVSVAGVKGEASRVACKDSRHEVEIAARWARRRVEDHPSASIGIVVPELQSKRAVIMQVFDSILLPQSVSPTEKKTERPYNISLGMPLSSYPIIQIAVQLLGLLSPTISMQDLSTILRSPFIRGWQQEADARSLLDAHLRRKIGELEISLKTLRYYANQKDKNDGGISYTCTDLVKNIDAWNDASKDIKRKQSAAQWAEKFSVLLKEFGWANGRVLSSEEFQVTEAWRDLLVSFAGLDAVSEAMTSTGAVSQLRTMANNRTFQARTRSLPIQVLGVLEAEEIQFDCLWVMGLHDGVWPSSPRANPFLPASLQQEAGLPHASEAGELQLARRATERFLHGAEEVVISYPKRDGDNELRVSALIENISEVEVNELALSHSVTWTQQIHENSELDTIEQDPAPPLGEEAAKGGSSILKYQANCPFRAFAELRLDARALESADIGLNAMERGTLIHEILKNTWRCLETQEKLLAASSEDLNLMVQEIADEEIKKIAWRYPLTFTERFIRIESERLCSRVIAWLEIEKERPSFKVVATEERDRVEIVDGVPINVIVDRIDELEDGRKIVIDYKTGSVQPKQWFGERLEDPQLPLYSMVTEGEVAVLAFAQVRVNEMAFKGVAEEKGLLPKVDSFEKNRYTEKETWNEVLQEWQQNIKALAENHRKGNAVIDPKNKQTCETTYCHLQSLCRINELMISNDGCTGDESGKAEAEI